MHDKNAKSQRILRELCVVDSEYVCERNKILFQNIVRQQTPK